MSDSVENSPGKRALEIMQSVHKELVFKKPSTVPRRRKRMKVLPEEIYVEEIGKIIERDFFPDLKKIQAQNEYLDAVEKNDAVKMRQLFMKYSGKKPPSQRLPSPATFETPTNIHPSEDDLLSFTPQTNVQELNTEESTIKNLTLDQYMNSHTSQDNESFEEILDNSERKHREKYKYLYGMEDDSEFRQDQLLELPSVQQQATLQEKPFNINSWGYKNKNYLMYNPDGVVPTHEEQLELLKNRQKVVYDNTHLRSNPFNEAQSKETINELAKIQARVLDGKIGVDGKELLKPKTPKIGGFTLVRTPSPSSSVLNTPLMTWGEIEGTPFRLDGSDTPIPRSQGPSFKMSEPPRREQIAIALAEKVGEKNRDQKKKAMDAQRRQFSSPSPRPNTSSIDRLASMSPAARKLASSHLRIPTSSSLLSPLLLGRSISRSPIGFVAKTPTPKRLMITPKRATTPKLNLGIKKAKCEKEVSTDDLLKINLPNRKKAADFFI